MGAIFATYYLRFKKRTILGMNLDKHFSRLISRITFFLGQKGVDRRKGYMRIKKQWQEIAFLVNPNASFENGMRDAQFLT
jgi:hypothetical protein